MRVALTGEAVIKMIFWESGMPLSRREFLIDSLASSTLLNWRAQRPSRSHYPFQHGVASGDPLHDGIILWTRITPTNDGLSRGASTRLSYHWVVATDAALTQVVANGESHTTAERDFTVKHDIRALLPGRDYYYAFYAQGQWSDTGHFKTLPEVSPERLRLAFTSCSNFAAGYFNVYRDIAERRDLDAVLHLGDYIYEYASLDESLVSGRVHEPMAEAVTLADYRARHACYKADRDSQAMHRQHALIAIWDDHEVANNAWQGGAANHRDATQGAWPERLQAAVQAYYEWMPVRESGNADTPEMYRGYRFGQLLDLSMLDTRLAGREAPEADYVSRHAPERTLLGEVQENWLSERLVQAQDEGVTWKLLGQQVMMAQFGFHQQPFNYDQWDGYPAARQRLFDLVEQQGITGWGVLTGDIHSSWAMTLHHDPFVDRSSPLGFELVTPAVTSEGIGNAATATLAAASLSSVLPHLNFVDFYYRGYVVLDITEQRLQAEWWVVDTVLSPRYSSACLRALTTQPLSPELVLLSDAEVAELTNHRHQELANNHGDYKFSQPLAFLREWRGAGALTQSELSSALISGR